MSGATEDPIDILDDETNDANNVANDEPMNEAEEDDPEEYVVEAIRARKKDPKSGNDIFLVKWEDYPETENTWEPAENLKCPEIVQRFLENEAHKRKKRKIENNHTPNNNSSTSKNQSSQSTTKRPKRPEATKNKMFIEDETTDEDDDDDSLTGATTSQKQTNREPTPEPTLRGFERGLELDKVLTASIGDNDKIYFFVKWQGLDELELLEVDELEKNAPHALCRWYRDKFFCNIKYDQIPA